MPYEADAQQQDIPSFWLKPANRQLTRLFLHGGKTPWCVSPFANFQTIGPFPQLISLHLGSWTVAHDWQIECITAHSSLKKLYMSDCFIVTSLLMTAEVAKPNFPNLARLDHLEDRFHEYYTHIELRWHEVFQRFRTELSLSYFVFGCRQLENGQASVNEDAFENRCEMSNSLTPQRYYMYDFWSIEHWIAGDTRDFYPSRSTGCNKEVVVRPSCDEDDEEEFERLLEAVRQRATAEA